MTSVATIILAGGKGSRLHPLTLHRSKPAVSYGGRYRLIDIPISNSINSDFRQIFVITQYLSEELKHYIRQTYSFGCFSTESIQVLTPQENEKGEKTFFKGTADAVRQNLPSLLDSDADYFLILSGDQLYNIDLQNMIAFAKEKKAELTIAAIPVLIKEAVRMGLLQINTQSRVVNFVEKPENTAILERFRLQPDFFETNTTMPFDDNRYYLGSMGIYVFTRKALVSLLDEDPRNDFGYHIIDTAVKTKQTSAFVYHGYWEDIGTVASYYEANLILTKHALGLDSYNEKRPIYTRQTLLPGPKIKAAFIKDSIICEGSIVEASEITNSVIGLRSQIQKGSILRNTVMMGNPCYANRSDEIVSSTKEFSIGKNCFIEKAIIDEQVSIGNDVKLVNRKNLQHYDSNAGVFIRDGIIIVTSGSSLPNHFTL